MSNYDKNVCIIDIMSMFLLSESKIYSTVYPINYFIDGVAFKASETPSLLKKLLRSSIFFHLIFNELFLLSANIGNR